MGRRRGKPALYQGETGLARMWTKSAGGVLDSREL